MDHDREAYRPLIEAAIGNTLSHTDLPLPDRNVGKVRDRYRLDEERLFIVTTDRQSAFDRVLANIPFKGAVLNLVSAWWFEQSKHIVPNHMISVPHPNASEVTSCDVFPIEVIVRGYITGTTDTSLWTHYAKGARTYCGNTLPEGLRKNQRLEKPMLTPTTKETHQDRPISPEEIIAEGWMEAQDWEVVAAKALELFSFGQQKAEEHGLILVDTKYEFGKDADGVIRIVDELHTPDSSRYWIGETYQKRFDNNEEPQNIDKEFLRLWFKSVCDPYRDAVLPEAPKELVTELSLRYITLYEMITGRLFPIEQVGAKSASIHDALLAIAASLANRQSKE